MAEVQRPCENCGNNNFEKKEVRIEMTGKDGEKHMFGEPFDLIICKNCKYTKFFYKNSKVI